MGDAHHLGRLGLDEKVGRHEDGVCKSDEEKKVSFVRDVGEDGLRWMMKKFGLVLPNKLRLINSGK